MIVYFVRHGGVENPLAIKYGRLSGFPLSTRGRAEAEKTARALSGRGIEVVYSSPLLRAKQTAEIFAVKLGLPIFYDDRLLELDLGKYQGIKESEFVDKALWRFGGETLEASGNRIINFLNSAEAENKYKIIAVVSHEGPIVMAVLNLSGRTVADYDSIKLPTAGFIKIEY